MFDPAEAPRFVDCRPVPAQQAGDDGWYTWNVGDDTRFNGATLGDLWVRQEGERVRLRMQTEQRHTNLQDMVHGAITLALIDVSLFAGMHILGEGESGFAVTLELSTQFVGPGKSGEPLDAVVEIVRETGRLMFLRGDVEQAGPGGTHRVAAFSGIVRK